MKFDLRQKAKSALSILLTLCMILSVMMVGISTVSAAENDMADTGANVDYAELGYSTTDNQYIKSNAFGQSTWPGKKMTDSGSNGYYIYSFYVRTTDSELRYYMNDGSYDVKPASNNHNNAAYDYGQPTSSGSNYFYVPSSSLTADVYNKVTVYWQPSGYNNNGYVAKAGIETVTNLSPSLKINNSTSNQTITEGDTVNLSGSVTANSNVGTVSYAYQYKLGSNGTWTACNASFKPSSPGTYYVRTIATDGGVIKDTNAWAARTETSSERTLTVKTKLKKPTITVSKSGAANVGDTDTTIAISNYSTITGQGDSNTVFELYKGNNKMTSGYTFNSTTGVFTLDTITASSAATYKVKAVAGNTASYADSETSDGAALKVYEPQFCLVGNINRGAIEINDTVVAPTVDNLTGAEWWQTWQDSMIIANTTSTPGVYTLTFKISDNAEREGNHNIGLYQKDADVQRAFIYNGTVYNTSNADITVTDAGISSGLYTWPVAATNAGGSLVLKKGQTYTITIDQTKSYSNSSSNPPGEIKITARDVFADTYAKKQSYNSTNRVYNSVSDAESTIGTAAAVPKHYNGNLTTELTATVENSNYEFIGWYSDAACTSQVYAASACTKSGDTYTKNVTISTTTTYYALFKQKQPTDFEVRITNPTGGTVSLTGGVASTGGSNTTAYEGATVSMSFTKTDVTKDFTKWKIISVATGADVTASVINANATMESASFTMPNYNVIVTAVLTPRTPVSIKYSSNNPALGTASGATGTHYIGDTITITATPTALGVFSKWQVTGCSVTSTTSASTTIKLTAANATVKAIFDYRTYYLYKDSTKYMMVRHTDGCYYSTIKIGNNVNFTVYDNDAATNHYAVSAADGTSWYIKTTDAVNVSSWGSSFTKYYHTDSLGSNEYYVKFDPTGNSNVGTVQLVATNPMGTIAQIYAKDGTIRYNSDTGTGDLWDDGGDITCKKGVTTVTQINSTAVPNPDSKRYGDHLRIYTAPIGSTITVKTTVNSTYNSKGWYVGMFVINGWKVPASKLKDGEYIANYTLSDEYDLTDTGSKKSFEITPVYYNSNFEYLTFYVDADSVPDKWGETVSVCATYTNNTGSHASVSHFEGSYPGQPLGREGDLYEVKVAKYYYTNSDNTWSKQSNYYPAATITSYNFDNVHHYYYAKADESMGDDSTNFQTYDYADFSYLAQIDRVESILFKCMPEATRTNSNRQYCDNTTLPSSGVNTYRLLTDYYGYPIDARGNRVLNNGVEYTAAEIAALTVSNAQVKIISCGNISNDNKGTSTNTNVAYNGWRTKGNWITAWKVFDVTDSKQIAVGSPADFINTNINTSGASATKNYTLTNSKTDADMEGKITYISYEDELSNKSSLSGEDNTGIRIDGQWYFSAQHDFYSDVQVATTTADDAGSVDNTNTAIETNTNSSNNDGFIGGTSGTTATLDGETKHLYQNVTTEAELSCIPGSGYTFVGWYIKDGDKYTKIGDNFTDLNATMTMKKNYTIVAVVKVVPSGSLVITHGRYSGSSPEAHTGSGKYYVSATIYNSSGNVKSTISEQQNSIPVTGLAADDKLEITLRTVCSGDDTFYAWYEEALGEDFKRTGKYYEICSEDEDPIGEKEVSYTMFQADCSTFFSGGTLARQTIDFYSDIVHVSAFATLTYKYYDRFAVNDAGKMVSYIVKNVELSAEEIDAGYIPSDDKITKYAPNVIDTIYTDTKWQVTGTKVQKGSSNVTLMATQDVKNCSVQYIKGLDATAENLFSADGSAQKSVNDLATVWTNATVPYNSYMSYDGSETYEEFYIKAPETITVNEHTWNFVRYDVYAFDHTTGELSSTPVFSCNDNPYGYRIYENCTIYPVYSETTANPLLSANIGEPVLNREVYGDSASFVDKLYVDMIVAYLNTDHDESGNKLADLTGVIKDDDDKNGYDIETGVILDTSVNLSQADYNTLKTAAEAGLADTTSSIISGYSGYIATTAVDNLIKNGTATSGLLKYVSNNANLTNKNRLDKVFKFTNKESVQKYVFAAYSYVMIKKNDTIVGYALSDPQKFNFCYIANKPLVDESIEA